MVTQGATFRLHPSLPEGAGVGGGVGSAATTQTGPSTSPWGLPETPEQQSPVLSQSTGQDGLPHLRD